MPHLQTTDGTELFYRDWGAGRPVVFVHGMLMSSEMWRYQAIHLTGHGFRAIACDRRGHGRSDDPGTGYEFDTLADDLAALLDRLDLTEVTLVGHSMGGGEIARYLSRHGTGRTARLALISSTVPKLDVDPQAAAALLGTLRTGYGQWVEENAALSFGDERPGCEVPRLDQEQAIRDWMGVSLDAAVACMTANLAADFTAELSSVDVPALIVHGDHDAFAPLAACGRRSAELMPRSRLQVYAGAAHMPHLSHRERLNADLLAFAGARDA
jgi:non-heme chloroperoxidase